MSQRQQCPNTGDWHVWNIGILIVQLQELEFSARVVIARSTGSGIVVDLASLTPGDWVPQDPMTSYDSLAAVLKKFNELASPERQLDVSRLVDLRDELAHGRIAVLKPQIFPLTYFKFGKSMKGKGVPVAARIDMTEAWFLAQRKLVHEALQMVADEHWRLERLG